MSVPVTNCLSTWFPILRRAGLPVPRTEIVRSGDLTPLLDGKEPEGFAAFMDELKAAGDKVGWPAFMRTGQGSNKHGWIRSCFVERPEDLPSHVANLVEWSHLVDFLGLPHDVWAVRELLPTVPQFHAFDGMPIVREFRFFVRGGEVVCSHCYWPRRALEEGFVNGMPDDWERRYEALCYLPAGDERELRSLASRAGEALGGDWSIDLLETKRGWYLTDVAVARQSFHWDGCERAEMFRKGGNP